MAVTRLTADICGRQHGNGPAMLLIHGVGMQADYWGNVEPHLAEHFSLTLIDMPGHGQSPVHDHSQPELPLYTDKISDVLLSLEQPAIIVGHSMGALIALDLAVRYPQLVSGVAVLNGVYRRNTQAQKAIDARVVQLKNQSLEKPDNRATLERWFKKKPSGIEAQSRELCDQWLQAVNPVGYFQAYSAFAGADAPADELLQTIECPSLFITGALEPNSTPAMSQRMSSLVAGATCTIVDNAKHMMSMTHGPQVIAAIVDSFNPST